MMNMKGLYKQIGWTLMMAWCVLLPALADDTELYVYDSLDSDHRAKMLLIFDTSGSMDEYMMVKKDYDPDTEYDSLSGLDDGAIYFIPDDEKLPDSSDDLDFSSFSWAVNNCATSYGSLQTYGYYIGYLKEHRYIGNSGSWSDLRTNKDASYTVVDCLNDFYLDFDSANGNLTTSLGADTDYSGDHIATTLNPAITTLQGNMVDGADPGSDNYYDLETTDVSGYTSGDMFTAYTANYLRWYYEEEDEISGEDSCVITSGDYSNCNVESKMRITVAQQAVTELVETTTNTELGLMRFNDDQGGRVVKDIQEYDDISTLSDVVNALLADGWTPLTETLYEASLFLQGEKLDYAKGYDDDDDDDGGADYADYDATINGEGKTYESPFTSTCDEEISIVYISDGAPTRDTDVDADIQKLSVSSSDNDDCSGGNKVSDCSDYYKSQYKYGCDDSWAETGCEESSLPIMAAWMHDNDLIEPDSKTDSTRQTANIYTIGFGDDAIADAEDLLTEAAARGGGYYSAATDATELQEALSNALIDIYDNSSTLVSPSITSNNANRTESLDRVYYSMFEPGSGPRWPGNLKKLSVSDDGYTVDTSGTPAIDDDGTILDSATTYWSSGTDGNEVAQGGVVEMLSDDATDRTLYFDGESSGSLTLEAFTKSNLEGSLGAGSATDLADHLGVATDEVENLVNWVKGIDVDDEDSDGSTTDNRSDTMGDPMHSTPLVINYGVTGESGLEDGLDIRIVVGTNAGVLHMFQDKGDSVEENWAFTSYDKLANQRFLRANSVSTNHYYGVDGSPVVYRYDANNDGVYKSSDGDKVWLYIGERRGGDTYYAFDISDPDSPSLMWRIDSAVTGFSELGQTWSTPAVVDAIPGYETDAENEFAKAVLIFGGGYDINKDASSPVDDSSGRGVFIVDAQTGALVHSFTPDSDSSTNTNVSFTDSMPATPAVLDSDSDGLTDRIYSADTGGDIWRIDLYSSDRTDWGAYKIAALGSSTSSAAADDRRFFNEIAIVRSYYEQVTEVEITNTGETYYNTIHIPFDGLLIGSGDKTRPNSQATVDNYLFLIRDESVDVVASGDSSFTAPDAIELTDLYDITSNPMEGLTGDALSAEEALYSSKSGWLYSLEETGEKSLGVGVVIDGTVYMTSYEPAEESECEVDGVGNSRLYTFELQSGTSSDGTGTRYVTVENGVLGDLVVYSSSVTITEDDLSTTDVDETVTGTLLRIFGGGGGESIVIDDEDDEVVSTCESSSDDCAEGSVVTDASLSTEQIYLYFKEEQ